MIGSMKSLKLDDSVRTCWERSHPSLIIWMTLKTSIQISVNWILYRSINQVYSIKSIECQNNRISSPYEREESCYFYILRYDLYKSLPTWNSRRIFQKAPHKTKLLSDIQPRGCQGTGDVPWRFSYIPNINKGLRESPWEKLSIQIDGSKGSPLTWYFCMKN